MATNSNDIARDDLHYGFSDTPIGTGVASSLSAKTGCGSVAS